jgi:spermidine/putrescine transport system permease protein
MVSTPDGAITRVPARRALGRGAVTYLLAAPAALVLLGLLLVPLLIVLRYAFAGTDFYGTPTGDFTLDQFKALLEPIYLPTVVRSLGLAAITTALSLLVGYPVAYFIAFKGARYRGILLLLVIIPFWTNFLVRISAWIMIMGRSGVINSLLTALGIIDRPIDMIPSLGAELVGMVYAFLPAAVFPIYAALASIDRSLVEAAEDLGCNRLATHRRVTIPLASTGIWAAGLFVFIPCLGVFVIPVLLGGGKDLLLGNLIVTLALEFRNIPFASAVAIVALVFVTIGLAWYLRVSSIAASRTG